MKRGSLKNNVGTEIFSRQVIRMQKENAKNKTIKNEPQSSQRPQRGTEEEKSNKIKLIIFKQLSARSAFSAVICDNLRATRLYD